MAIELNVKTAIESTAEIGDSVDIEDDDETVDATTNSVSSLDTRVTALESALAELEERVTALEGGE